MAGNQPVNLKNRIKSSSNTDKDTERLREYYAREGSDNSALYHPVGKKINEKLFRQVIFLLAFLMVAGFLYWLFFYNPDKYSGETKWYSIKLVNGEVYYGQVDNISADPVVVTNVYYNYEQLEGTDKDIDETGNLRLVKRGKETHGPDGTMNIVREQILYLEPLADDSKVLKAIMDYEK